MPEIRSKIPSLIILMAFGLTAASLTSRLQKLPQIDGDESPSLETSLLSESLVPDSSPLDMETQMLLQAYARLLDTADTPRTDSDDCSYNRYLEVRPQIRKFLHSLLSRTQKRIGGLELAYLTSKTWGSDLLERLAKAKVSNDQFALGPFSYFGLYIKDIVDAVTKALGPSEGFQTTLTFVSVVSKAFISADISDLPHNLVLKKNLGPFPTFPDGISKDSVEYRTIVARVWDLLTEIQPSDHSAYLSWFSEMQPHLDEVFAESPATFLALYYGRKLMSSDILPASQTEYFSTLYHYLVGFVAETGATEFPEFCAALDNYLDEKNYESNNLPYYLTAKIHIAAVAGDDDYSIQFMGWADEELKTISSRFASPGWEYFRHAVDQAFKTLTGWELREDQDTASRLRRVRAFIRFRPNARLSAKHPEGTPSSIFWLKDWVPLQQII